MHHPGVLATFVSVLFLAFFTLMPLHWVAIGAPWASIAVAFVAIPLIDALVGSRRRVDGPPRPIPLVRWIPRMQLPLQAALLDWELCYNTVRPHQALGYLTPAEWLVQAGYLPRQV